MTQFTWNNSVGVWGTATNWLDVTDGDIVPAVPPGASDSVTIAGSSIDTITGPGASSDLTILGNVTLTGTFTTGALAVGQTSGASGALSLSAGTTLSAHSATLLGNSVMSVSGSGSALIGTGTLTIGSVPGPGVFISPELTISNHARVQVAGLTLLGDERFVSIDGSSSLEVGNTGSAAAGALTVDAGSVLAGSGSLDVTKVIDNGTVVASGGTLSVGTVSGSGILEIGTGSTLVFTDFGAPIGTSLDFTGSNASVVLTTSYIEGVTSGTFHGVISGFAAGDTIFPGINANIATWTPGNDGLGGLSISSPGPGSYSEGTPRPPFVSLTLAGDYTGQTFYVIPASSEPDTFFFSNPGPAIVLGASPGSGPAPAGTSTHDAYQWIGASGAWGDAANWQDTTINADPAIVAPGSLDAVTISGSVGPGIDLITGLGDAASLGVTHAVALGGTFAIGTLTVGAATGDNGTLDVLSGTTLATDSALINAGNLVVSGSGATLTDSGAALIQGGLSVGNGASVEVASLTLSGNASVGVDDASTLEVGHGGDGFSDAFVVDAGATVSGTGSISGQIFDNGTIIASGGVLALSSPTQIFGNDGELEIGADATLSVSAGDVIPSIDFVGPGSSLSIGEFQNGQETDPTDIAGLVSGFTFGDSISLDFAASTARWTADGSGAGQLLIDSAYAISLLGDYSDDTFVVTQESGLSTITLACFCSGSRILTERGEVAVEDLHVGENVVTSDGAQPIRWIGQRRIDLARHPQPDRARPVRIRQGAFGDGTPHRDLLLSPDHAVFVDGVLIPVKHLLNGTNIVVDRTIGRPHYCHIELENHAILFAEGLTVESLLPGSDRSGFENGGKHIQLHPEFNVLTWEAHGYAPLVVYGAALDEIRKRLSSAGSPLLYAS